MLFWLAGAFSTMCGILMFAEYGLTSPRFLFDGIAKKAVPRSGGELYYLKDIFKKPHFFAVCLYGIAFLLLGNVATNSINFGIRVMQATGYTEVANWQVRGIAIAITSLTCLIHACFRLGGKKANPSSSLD